MNENDKSLLDMLAEMLATMTARAIRAEQERDKELKNAIEWYERWKAKSEEVEKLKADLAAAKEEHERTQSILSGVLKVNK